jgi:hypothetical protein
LVFIITKPVKLGCIDTPTGGWLARWLDGRPAAPMAFYDIKANSAQLKLAELGKKNLYYLHSDGTGINVGIK